MPTNVAKARRAEQGVGNGVQQHVGVGVAIQAFLEGDGDAADNELAPDHQRVHVKALTYPHFRPFSRLSAMTMSAG